MKKRVIGIFVAIVIIIGILGVIATLNIKKKEIKAKENVVLYQERYDKLMADIKNTKKVIIGGSVFLEGDTFKVEDDEYFFIKSITDYDEILEYINIFSHIKIAAEKDKTVITRKPLYVIRLMDSDENIIEDFTYYPFTHKTNAPLELDSKYLENLKELIER